MRLRPFGLHPAGVRTKRGEGARGLPSAGRPGRGKIGDKGTGIWGAPKGSNLHPDDVRLDFLYNHCARLGMPINMHVSDPIWAYEPMDNTNDGLMNCYRWRITVGTGLLGHNELIESLEHAVSKHPKTTFIACHIANLEYDLTRLGQMLDRNPNLNVDVAARFGEIAPIARATGRFIERYPDRVLYGTTFKRRRALRASVNVSVSSAPSRRSQAAGSGKVASAEDGAR